MGKGEGTHGDVSARDILGNRISHRLNLLQDGIGFPPISRFSIRLIEPLVDDLPKTGTPKIPPKSLSLFFETTPRNSSRRNASTIRETASDQPLSTVPLSDFQCTVKFISTDVISLRLNYYARLTNPSLPPSLPFFVIHRLSTDTPARLSRSLVSLVLTSLRFRSLTD